MGESEAEAEAIGEEEVIGWGGVIGEVIGGVAVTGEEVEVRARVEKIEALEALETKWRGQ